MEWVETTARTVEEAKDAALDQLGVDEQEADFEVLEEPRAGLFGRVRGEARVRARVSPKAPRPKAERRTRNKAEAAPASDQTSDDVVQRPAPRRRGGGVSPDPAPGNAPAASVGPAGGHRDGRGDGIDDSVVTVEEQAEIVTTFLAGLLDVFGAHAEITTTKIDDEMVEVAVVGEGLGLLIGPKGQTLLALQDLCRTVLQRKAPGRHEGRFRIDISGYRARRREALVRFTESVAAQVVASGVQKALEPMGAADRKVVHDTANDIEGVATLSEGDDPRRRVVILPAQDS